MRTWPVEFVRRDVHQTHDVSVVSVVEGDHLVRSGFGSEHQIVLFSFTFPCFQLKTHCLKSQNDKLSVVCVLIKIGLHYLSIFYLS